MCSRSKQRLNRPLKCQCTLPVASTSIAGLSQQSSASEYELAEQYGISRTTVQRWKHRDSFEDRSHTPHWLQTTLNAAQEELVIYLRKQLRLSLDDLLAVVREFVHPTMGLSSLHRFLVRRGVDQLPKPSPESSPAIPFKAYEPAGDGAGIRQVRPVADPHDDRLQPYAARSLAPLRSQCAQ
jgi:hypothetical protein